MLLTELGQITLLAAASRELRLLFILRRIKIVVSLLGQGLNRSPLAANLLSLIALYRSSCESLLRLNRIALVRVDPVVSLRLLLGCERVLLVYWDLRLVVVPGGSSTVGVSHLVIGLGLFSPHVSLLQLRLLLI